MDKCEREEIDLGAVLAQKIWLRRNSVVYEGPFAHPAQIFKKATAIMEDFHRFNVKENGGACCIASRSTAIYLEATS